MRGQRSGVDRLRAVGGKRTDEEATVVFETRTSDCDVSTMRLLLLTSRRAEPFEREQKIDSSSGLFVGPPYDPTRVEVSG